MNITLLIVLLLCLGSIIAGILLLKQSAKKFNLTEEQKQRIKAREIEQQQKDN